MAEQVGEIYYDVDFRLDGMTQKTKTLEQNLDKVEGKFKETDKAANQLNAGLSSLAKAVSAVIAASALRDMALMVQRYEEMSERVQMATSSQAEFEMVQKRLLNTANNTYRQLSEAQELYIRTADSLRVMGYSTSQALDVTDSMSFAFVKNATSAERADAAISAMSKSVNTGKVAADQWETITSAIPSVINDIATASGRTGAEIRKLGAEGKLTAAALTEGLRKALDSNTQAAANMATNLTDAGVRTRTAITQVLKSLEDQTGALRTVTDGIIMAAEAMLVFGADSEKMATFLNTAETAATSLAAVVAGRLVMAVGAYSKALVTQAAAGIAATRAADANLRLAQAEATAAANALMQAAASEKAAVGLSTHGAAANALVATQTRATAATAALTAATTTAAAASRIGAVAFGALRTAMGFLGGPAGVIFLAATALYSFVGSAEEAKPRTDALTASVNQLGTAAERATERFKALTTGIDGLNKSELSMRKGELEDQLRNAEGQLKAFQRQFERGVGSIGQVEGAKAAVDELRGALEKLNNTAAKPAVSSAVSTDEGKPGKKPKAAAKSAAEKLADDVKAQVAALELQAETLGMTSGELELYKLQLAGATDEQIRAAQSSLSLIEAFEQQADAEEAMRKRREAFGANPAATITGTVTPLQGGQFDEQTARYEAEKLAEETRYKEQLERLRMAKEAQVEVIGGYQALEQEMAQTHADRLIQIEQARNEMMMKSLGSAFGQMASDLSDYAAVFGKESSAITAMAKTAAIAQTVMSTYEGAQKAYTALAGIPYIGPALGAAAAGAAIAGGMARVAQIRSSGGRAMGGPVQAGGMYRINETGAPEVFNGANGRQYMLPNQRGDVVSNKDATSSEGGGQVVVSVNLYQDPGKAGTVNQRREGENEMIDIFVADLMGDGKSQKAIASKFGLRAQGQ